MEFDQVVAQGLMPHWLPQAEQGLDVLFFFCILIENDFQFQKETLRV